MEKGEMIGKIFGIALVGLIIGAMLPLGSFASQSHVLAQEAKTRYVDDDLADYPDADFTKIQDAVDAASPGDKIFDNGIWWIEKDSSEPHFGWMKIYLDGEYKGECSRLEFGHKVEGVDSWPTVAVIYASGYIRLKECREPDIDFGTSFVLGPAYWEGGEYYEMKEKCIKEIRINSSEPFGIQIKATLPHFDVTYDIEMLEPNNEAMKIHVQQMYECTNQFTLNESRLDEHEGFKIVRFSSMHIDGTYHDSDGAKYIDESWKLITKKFGDLKTDQFIFDEPKKFGENWLECTHSDDYGWQVNTPNCIIYLDDLTLAKECTPQGWIEITGDPNNDNVGLWIHHDKAQLEWNVGDKNSVSYWLVAQDDPKSMFVAEWVGKADTPDSGGYGEAVVSIGNSVYIARCLDASCIPQFWRYDPATDDWNSLGTSELPTGAFRNGTALTGDGSNYIYALLGGRYSDSNRRLFCRYAISDNSWEQLADTPHAQGAGDAITWSGYDNHVYAVIGSKEHGTVFARYSYDSWEVLPFNPTWTVTDDGSSLVYTAGEYLYALRGEWLETVPNGDFARYHIPTQTWQNMTPIPENDGVGDGASLLWGGSYLNEYSDYIFALGGGAANEEPGYNFYCHSISSNTWEALESIPCPVGYYVGNRLGCDNERIYYWQGAPSTWNCGGDAFYMLEVNNPPNTPSNPFPAGHATGVSINADLSWTGGDPDVGDTVTYDVYFGTSASPPLVSNDQSACTYDPGTLSSDTKYYWKIVARDSHDVSAIGPLWDFTTTTTSLKDVQTYVGEFDPIRRMLYVFVRDYDSTPATCEKVEWLIDGPYGIFESLLEGTDEACTNACYPVDYWDCQDAFIAADGRSGAGCTRVMTAAEIAKFVAVAELEFADEDDADDYAIAGVRVLSSHIQNVNISIKIHDCWEGEVTIITEDLMVWPLPNDPAVELGLAAISDKLVMAYGYRAGEGVGGWTVYNPEWAVTHPEWNTLTTLYQGRGYWVNVNAACPLTYETQSYDLDEGWNLIGWVGC